jgi:hypothetical protein
MLLMVGCHEEGLPHFGSLQYESESFEVWASDGLEACGGTFEHTERWLEAFRERVGEHGSPGRHTFYWLTPEDFEDAPCLPRLGCAHPTPNVIYSTVIPIEHEIVHTEMARRPPSVLREGVAEVFGSIASPYTTSSIDLDPLFDDDPIPGGTYQTAGRFSRFIIERHGIDAYFALFEALHGKTGRDALAVGVEQTLGVELTTLVADFETSSPCSVARWRYFDHECSTLPLTPWESPTRWATEIDLSCTAGDVIGPRQGLVWTLRALQVEQAGSFELTLDSTDETALVAILSCNANCFDGEPVPVIPTASMATGGHASIFLEAGRHWMRVEHSDASDASVSIVIEQ